ncbi:Zinc transporter ZIP13 [Plutella xylostella]|uniref:Zinc transporter ZIP13 n=2 Tax=Plutella xylostella TaxID=51655 RepID=A0ABQ7PWS8_PLUXY|nr:Zinc transporter ZIP13 [Plutella xylostella]
MFNNNGNGEGACCNATVSSKCSKGGRWMGRCILREAKEKALLVNTKTDEKDPNAAKHVAGYLNLMANSIDNFTHGLAVGGSFLVGFRVGVLTTFAILVHEIPHEVGDFAILLKSGFSRWEAAKAQFATASAGLIGAMTAVIFSGARNAIEAKTSWIVPFTAGGFLHIALVTVLPDLLREQDKRQSLKHLAALLAGIAVMAVMTHYF